MEKIKKIVNSALSDLSRHYYSLLYLLKEAAPAWQKLGSNSYKELEEFYLYSREQLERHKAFLNKMQATLQSKLDYNYLQPAESSLLPPEEEQLKRALKIRTDRILERESFKAPLCREQLDTELKGWYKKYIPLIACLQVYARIERYYLRELCSEDLSLLQALLELQLKQVEGLINEAMGSFLHNERVIELKNREQKRAEDLRREKRQLKSNSHRLKRGLAGHYRLLKVAPCSPLHEVKSSWKRQVKRYHPDFYGYDRSKQEEAERLTQRLNRAYQEIKEFYKRMNIVQVP